jgi:dipeptidyl aminopeptidase/acylaminoacyl peptidase
MEADIGAPQWTFGLSRYAFLDDGRIAAIADADGVQRLVAIGPDGAVDEIGFPHRCIIHYLVMGAGRLWTLGGDAGTPIGLVGVDPDSGDLDVVRRDSDVSLDEAWYSAPEHIVAPTTDGAVTHAFFYPPTNPDFTAPDGTLPPLVVLSHGGPTSATRTSLDLGIQYWTSRGIGVVDVDYRGSTGYGRDYRRALEGRWGIVDTEDCIAAARHLVEKGLADGDRLAIRGGSAGGYTTLCALAFHDVFRVGASYFGVADLAALTEHTHKFESRYLDSMVGPYPETEDVYRARSPVHHADGITCPVLLLQGSEDRIVLPEQAEAMLQPLADRGIPHAYILFEGEGHGFRAAATVIAATEAELWFYGRMLGFEPADDLPEIPLR